MTIEHDRQTKLAHLYRLAHKLWSRPEAPVRGPEADLALGLSSLYYNLYHEFPAKPDKSDYDTDVWLPPEPPEPIATDTEEETTDAPPF